MNPSELNSSTERCFFLQIPSKALCIPDVIKGHGQSINCKTKSLWSPVGPGFGLDKDLRQLLKELRPLEFADLQYQLIRTREGSKLDADDEWANTASLFGSNFGEGNKIDGLGPVGWGQGYGYGYGQSSDEFFGGDICDNLTFDLPDEVIRPVDFRNYEDDNFLTFNIDTDTDHRKSEKFLNAKDRRCSDNLSKKRKKSNDGAYQIDQETEITSDDSDDGIQINTDAIISKSNDLEVTKICAAPVSAMRNCRYTSYKKSLQASASSGLTSVTNIICRPLLPVSIVQQLLRRFISPPPSRSLIK